MYHFQILVLTGNSLNAGYFAVKNTCTNEAHAALLDAALLKIAQGQLVCFASFCFTFP